MSSLQDITVDSLTEIFPQEALQEFAKRILNKTYSIGSDKSEAVPTLIYRADVRCHDSTCDHITKLFSTHIKDIDYKYNEQYYVSDFYVPINTQEGFKWFSMYDREFRTDSYIIECMEEYLSKNKRDNKFIQIINLHPSEDAYIVWDDYGSPSHAIYKKLY